MEGKKPILKPKPRSKAIRENCLDCCGNLRQAVKFCTLDGEHSTWCALWPYRFGCGPQTAIKRHGAAFLTPGELPGPDVALEACQKAQEALEGVAYA